MLNAFRQIALLEHHYPFIDDDILVERLFYR